MDISELINDHYQKIRMIKNTYNVQIQYQQADSMANKEKLEQNIDKINKFLIEYPKPETINLWIT